ncbi:SDR family NAD(P)-dependent oxidoreductase [Lacipirellula parvula]|uniref:D-beta-hydroxybutyrate dehydrogenase n=1 Tax=Lacipirellula parvula TaxID=2650471 RepID=A0A5K7X9Y0_9BACT|nr:SDR family oxidoreductase [Lacipirellula parvula]BBO33348.1 D-beta-hydroxybutyrate dehydrogenase [Lacipirellula parvula]
MLLTNRVILLTGGADGIGRKCAEAYAAAGAKVAIADLSDTRGKELAGTLGDGHLCLKCDVSHDDQVAEAVQQVLETYGRLDAIHNNAGIAGPSTALHETTDGEWDDLLAVNLKSIYFTTKYGIEALAKSRGVILNTSSMAGVIGQAAHAAYAATKGAINALTKSMALDYAPLGVRVNAICPAAVWTPMLRQWAADQPDPASMSAYLDAIHPLGPCPEGDVVADAAVFLLSDQARFITGHLLHLSGGAELGYRR